MIASNQSQTPTPLLINNSTIKIERFVDQLAKWPTTGRHILAQSDDTSVIVYQAYRPSIGEFAAKHQYFGGDFSLNRMSWIKTDFLWMMYRSGWGTKTDQEVTLAIRLKRTGFDAIIGQAVESSLNPDLYGDELEWKKDVETSEVRLQWDPAHAPSGAKQERRAIQLGMRGTTLAQYAREWIVEISDISDFVAFQREKASDSNTELLTPSERIYRPQDESIAHRLGLS